MKKFLTLSALLAVFTVNAQVPPPPAASQAEVNAGTLKNKYVSPFTLANRGVASTNTVDLSPIISGKFYTNSTGSNLFLSVSMTLASTVSGSASMTINVDTNQSGNWRTIAEVQSSSGAVRSDKEELTAFIPPGWAYVVTNGTLSGGALVAINYSARTYSGIGTGSGSGSSVTVPIANTLTNGLISSNDFSQVTLIPHYNGEQPPLMGFESWVLHNTTVSEYKTLDMMTNMIKYGYFAAGYNSILIDEAWTTNRDGNGNLVATAAFPNGMPWLISVLHSNGFKAGLFFPLGNSGVATVSGSPAVGSAAYLERDATNAAAWGVDFVHLVVDDNGYSPSGGYDPNYQKYKQFIKYLQGTGKRILVYGTLQQWEPWVQGGMDAVLYAGFPGYVDGNGQWTTTMAFVDGLPRGRQFMGPGHYLEFGWLGYGLDGYGQNSGPATRAMYGMLALWQSPLFIANVYATAGSTYNFVSTVQTNAQMIAIDQDPLVIPPTLMSSNNFVQVWYKPLAPAGSGRFALGLLNRDTNNARSVTVAWTNFPVAPTPRPGPYLITDVFEQTNGFAYTNGVTFTLTTNSLTLLTLTPTNLPAVTNWVSFNLMSGQPVPGNGATIILDDGTSFISGAIGSSALRISHGTLEIFNWQFPRERLTGTNIAVVQCFVTTSGSSPNLTYTSRVAATYDDNTGGLSGSVALTKTLSAASTKFWVTNYHTITSTNAAVYIIGGSGNASTAGVIDLMEIGAFCYP